MIESPFGDTRISVMNSLSSPLLPLISSGLEFDCYTRTPKTPIIKTPTIGTSRYIGKGKGKSRSNENYSRSVGRTPKQSVKSKPSTTKSSDTTSGSKECLVSDFLRSCEAVPYDNNYISVRTLFDHYLCWNNGHQPKLKYLKFGNWLRTHCTIVKFRGANHIANYHILGTPFIEKNKTNKTNNVSNYPLPVGRGNYIPLNQLTASQIADLASFLQTKVDTLSSAIYCGSYREIWTDGQISISLTKQITNLTSRRIEYNQRKEAGKEERVLTDYRERYEVTQTNFQRTLHIMKVQIFKEHDYAYFTRKI